MFSPEMVEIESELFLIKRFDCNSERLKQTVSNLRGDLSNEKSATMATRGGEQLKQYYSIWRIILYSLSSF